MPRKVRRQSELYEVTLKDSKGNRRTLQYHAISFAEAELFVKILGNMTSDEQIVKIEVDWDA